MIVGRLTDLGGSVAQWLGRWLVIERSRVRLPASPLPSNNSGQVVHTHVPLSPSSIIWYRPNRWEGNGSIYITELCLQLTAGSRPVNGDEHRALRSQSCERALLTTGDFTFFYFFKQIFHEAMSEELRQIRTYLRLTIRDRPKSEFLATASI